MVRKWTVGATGFALLATTFVVVACSSKGDDDDSSGGSSSGATGGTMSTAGKGGTGTGGSTGGTGGTLGGSGGTGGSTGGSAGTAVTTGGMGGTSAAGTAGMSMGGGAGAGGPYACPMPTPAATCDSWDNWGMGDMAWFGSGMFTGGFSIYGAGLTRDTTVTDKIHITGMVSTYSGFNIWFSTCADLSAYTGVSFVLDGMSMSATPNTAQFSVQTNSDYPWQPRPQDKKGACTAEGTADPYGVCIPPSKNVAISATPVAITWADLETAMTGTPVKFTAAMSSKEIIGLQWQFPWDSTATAYAVDITLDKLTFTGGTGAPKDCGTMVGGGTGGMGAGGASSGGASSGGASSGGASSGGATVGGNGGMGGAAAGAAGATGGGMGGMSGGGGRGGRGGAGAGGATP